MSCDGYHTTVEPADLPFQGSSMREVQCKLGCYGSCLEHQSSYLPHVPCAPLTDTPPLMPPMLLLMLFVLLYLHPLLTMLLEHSASHHLPKRCMLELAPLMGSILLSPMLLLMLLALLALSFHRLS